MADDNEETPGELPEADDTAAGAKAEAGVAVDNEASDEPAAPVASGTPITKLHDLRPAPGSKKRKIRVGRGESGRRGKTAGRGTKGQKARNNTRAGFEGGQTPLVRRLPKAKGFKNPFRVEYNVINLDVLADFPAGTEVTPDVLKDRGLVHHKGLVKVLGDGALDHALTVKANAFSKAAREKIEASGGSTEVV